MVAQVDYVLMVMAYASSYEWIIDLYIAAFVLHKLEHL